ncbi:MAG: hypothetical protein SO144_07715, partial [Campylobacter sp.]|nr:hypothetical protein [Campylobacter sp.]
SKSLRAKSKPCYNFIFGFFASHPMGGYFDCGAARQILYLAFATPQPKYLKNPNLGLRVLAFQNENFWNSARILEFLGQNLEFLGKILEFLG